MIARKAARSRERLGVETLDLYGAHAEDRSVPLEGTVVGALVAESAVHRLGSPTTRPGGSSGKDHRFGFVSDETVDHLQTHPELELWVYSSLVQGSCDRADRPSPAAYDHPGTTARLAALDRVAEARGVPRSQVVLLWLAARGWRPIVGVSTLEQLTPRWPLPPWS